jgi:hypothetical protein
MLCMQIAQHDNDLGAYLMNDMIYENNDGEDEFGVIIELNRIETNILKSRVLVSLPFFGHVTCFFVNCDIDAERQCFDVDDSSLEMTQLRKWAECSEIGSASRLKRPEDAVARCTTTLNRGSKHQSRMPQSENGCGGP